MKQPRVLILSVPVWNTESGSDTLSNLLSGYGSENVANIYFKSGIPSSDVCRKYFFISENAVIKSIFKKDSTGFEIDPGRGKQEKVNITSEQETEKNKYSFFSKHRLWT